MSNRYGSGLWLVTLMLLGAACAGPEPRKVHPELSQIWRSYQQLPGERALAVAGELRQQRWVAGATGGHASRDDAVAAALAECRARRQLQRMRAQCRVYAIGDEAVGAAR